MQTIFQNDAVLIAGKAITRSCMNTLGVHSVCDDVSKTQENIVALAKKVVFDGWI
jgi:hypothetical protein